MAIANDVIQKSGAWFSYENENIGQGRENTRRFLKENVKLINKIEKQILEKVKNKALAA